MIKKIVSTLILTMLVVIFQAKTASAVTYKLLAPFNTAITTVDTGGFSAYLQQIIDIGIALTAAISVLMLIIGGLQYIFSSVSEKSKNEAKERITNAILGILIILSSYLILKTIDPNLLSLKFPGLPTNQTIIDAAKGTTPPTTP